MTLSQGAPGPELVAGPWLRAWGRRRRPVAAVLAGGGKLVLGCGSRPGSALGGSPGVGGGYAAYGLAPAAASGKVAVLCEGPKRAYLVYRFGTAAKVELQYPAVLAANSWKKFTYSSYHRMANPVAERYRLSFKNGGTEYELFDMMDAVTTKDGDEVYPHEVGVVITLPKGKIITIKGKPSSVQGSLELLDEQRARVQMGE